MSSGTSDSGYLLDNRQHEAGRRFGALSALFDPTTFRHFERVGVDNGWHCWEVGAGGDTVPAWLASRVGTTGRVLATDIDPSWLPEGAPYEVLRHDVGVEPPPAGPFDLVHARLLLVHVTQRAEALAGMVSALKPGGWLVLEEADPMLQPLVCPDEVGEPERLANRLKNGFRELMLGRGVDLALGRRLPRLMRDSGLLEVEADAYFPVSGPQGAVLEEATTLQIRDRLVSNGIATNAEVDEHLANVRSGRLDLATSPMISALGRKPFRA